MVNRDYKFYLAFENANCHDYITEKFYLNGLGNNVVPIVMGAHPDEYRKRAPVHSYIHVEDFESPSKLAKYLKYLESNESAYNEYLQWKASPPTGQFINTFFWCRLCALLHSPGAQIERTYPSMHNWWFPPEMCTTKSGKWKST